MSEDVLIKIKVVSDDSAIDKTTAKLKAMGKTEGTNHSRNEKALASRSTKLEDYGKEESKLITNTSRKWKHHFDSVDKMIVGYGKSLIKFVATSAKMAALEIAGLSAAMLAAHAAFAAGGFIMKAYRGTMHMAAGGVAGLVIALGTAAAAMREQQAAMYAYTSAFAQRTEFKTNLNSARVNMRLLTGDTDLAVLGANELGAAYGEIYNKSKKFDANSSNLFKGLMDFAAAGQDIKAGSKAAATLVGELTRVKQAGGQAGSTFGSISSAAKAMGPAMVEAMRKFNLENKKLGTGKKGKEALMNAITSGHLAELGGVTGQFEAVNGTLLNMAKGYFNRLKMQFGDFGQSFLAPVKKELDQVFKIVSKTILRMQGQIMGFGQNGGFIDKISVVVDKISNFFVGLMRNYLPGTIGMFKKMGDWWHSFKMGFKNVMDEIKPMIDGARVIEQMLKNVFSPIWAQLKEKFGSFRQELLDMKPAVEEFGTKVGVLIGKVMEYGGEVRKVFFQALPFINKVIAGVTVLVEQFTSLVGFVQKFTKGIGGAGSGMGSFGLFSALFGAGRGLANHKGGWIQEQNANGIRETANMSVTAGVVTIDGKGIAHYGDPNAPGLIIEKNKNTLTTTKPLSAYDSTTTASESFLESEATREALGSGSELGRKDRGDALKDWKHRGSAADIAAEKEAALSAHEAKTGRKRGDDFYYKGRKVNYTARDLADPITVNGEKTTGPSTGVFVPKESRVNPVNGRKTLTANGRIISRRESVSRFFGESQRHGESGFQGDTGFKNFYDRKIRDTRFGQGLQGAGTRYTQRLMRNRNYIDPTVGSDGTSDNAGFRLRVNNTTSSVFNPKGFIGKRVNRFYQGGMYNNYFSAQSGDPDNQGPVNRTKLGRGITNMKAGFRNSRQSRMGQNIFGSKTKRGFNNSATAGIGTSLGMGLLSSKMDESAQGSMALGAGLASTNPLLGLGIGFGGAALNSKTGKGGAVLGAAAGAAIGTMIAPGIGTAIGTVVGAIAGGVKGYFNRINNEKTGARKAVSDITKDVYSKQMKIAGVKIANQNGIGQSSIKDVLSNTQASQQELANRANSLQFATTDEKTKFITDLYKNKQGNGTQGMTEDDYKNALKQKDVFLGKLGDMNSPENRANRAMDDQYKKRLKELTKITGLSEMGVENLARSMDFNLMDPMKSFTDVIDGLGIAAVKTTAQMQGMQIDNLVNNLDVFDKAINNIEAPQILDEKGAVFNSKLNATAGIKDKDILEFFKSAIPDIATLAGGGFNGILSAKSMFGKGGSAFSQIDAKTGVKGYLYGQQEKIYGTDAAPTSAGQVLTKYLDDATKGATAITASNLNNTLLAGNGKAGNRYSVNADLMSSKLIQMSNGDASQQANAKALNSAIEQGTMFQGVDMSNQDAVTKALSSYGLQPADVGLQRVATDEQMITNLEDIKGSTGDMATALKDFTADFSAFFASDKQGPEWFTTEAFQKLIDKLHGDTSSPRGKGIGDTTSSRLETTMARHASINSQLGGSRTMTSAFRTTGLGSPSSDHVMGRAYDLTGQQLGAYAGLVRDGGGFAEFHGRGGDRHLHVVPGPGSGAIGDTMSPISFGAARTSGGGGTSISNSYTVNVSGANANVQEIASMVVRKIKDMNNNERQRS